MDLPHTLIGYMQVEETDFRRATDTQVYTKLGSNINYLKDQSDLTNTAGVAAFASTYNATKISAPVTADGAGNFSTILFDTPNGSPILFAVVVILSAGTGPSPGINNNNPLMVLPGIGLVQDPMTHPAFPFIPVYAICQAQIVGPNNNQLYVAESNAGGYVSAGAGLHLYASVVYPSVYP